MMDEIGDAVDTIAGLRVLPWGTTPVEPPAAMITLPDSIEFDSTYGRGSDRFRDVIVMLLVGRAVERTALKALAPYCAGAGPLSIKAAVEGYAYTTFDATSLQVVRVDFPSASVAGVEYLAAAFHIDLSGPGA